MNFTRCRRVAALAAVLPWLFVRLAAERARGPLTPQRRAQWLHASCRSVLRVLGMAVRMRGTPPASGLLVSNHLSYLDIAVFASVSPCVFVSKSEVAQWPYFGAAARAAGTVFLDRTSHASAVQAGEAMKKIMASVPVLLFPEGTSSDGTRVLRFHSSLFEPAVATQMPITPAAIRYAGQSIPEQEMCWFGDAGFVPHLWKLLGMRGLSCEVCFAAPKVFADRRLAATAAQQVVEELRAAHIATADLQRQQV